MSNAITKHTTYKFYARTVRELAVQLADIAAVDNGWITGVDSEFTIEGFGGAEWVDGIFEITVAPRIAGQKGAAE